MNYYTLLVLHSFIRWIVLLALIFSLFRAYRGYKYRLDFTKIDEYLRLTSLIFAHFQLVLGLGLYFSSPIVMYFLSNFKEAIHQREIRFFGMEHISVMVVAIILITIGTIKSKRQQNDRDKFRIMYKWYGIALLAILSSIPWAFSPLVHRPYFRPF